MPKNFPRHSWAAGKNPDREAPLGELAVFDHLPDEVFTSISPEAD